MNINLESGASRVDLFTCLFTVGKVLRFVSAFRLRVRKRGKERRKVAEDGGRKDASRPHKALTNVFV